MIAFYDNQPTKLEAVGNGSYVYRFNIEELVPVLTEENAEEKKCRSGNAMKLSCGLQ